MRKVSLTCAIALTLAACGLSPADVPRDREQPRAVAATTSCESQGGEIAEGNTFVAPTYREGDLLVMPVVFPDGTTSEVLLPPDARVESFLPTGRTWMNLAAGSDAGRGVSLSYGTLADTLKSGDASVECYDGAHGVVEVWRSGWEDLPHWMFFPLGSWTARVGDGNLGRFLDTEERESWAANLSATEKDGGWPVIEPTDELTFGLHGTKTHEVELEFWEDGGKRGVLLWPVACKPDPADKISHDLHDTWFANLCFPDDPMIVHVYGEHDENFVRSLAEDLDVRSVRLAYPNLNYQQVP
jgi:hypothetical protein